MIDYKKWLSEIVIRENSYGVVKRLRFIMSAIERCFGRSLDNVRILEVGCGSGNLISIPLAKRGLTVVGIDIHFESIAYARRIAAQYPNLVFHHMPVEECRGGYYDVVICSEVLEHVSTYREFFAEIVEKMKADNSILILTVPSGYGPFELQKWIWRNAFEDTWLYRFLRDIYRRNRKRDLSRSGFLNKDSPHVNFFRFRQLRTLFEQHGLEIEEYQGKTFLCGFLVDFLLGLPSLCAINNFFGSVLPYWMVSGWMFVLSRSKAT
jgi:SAM-dependent methyltransferase